MSDTIDARLAAPGIAPPTAAPVIATCAPCVPRGDARSVPGRISSGNGALRRVGRVGRDVAVGVAAVLDVA